MREQPVARIEKPAGWAAAKRAGWAREQKHPQSLFNYTPEKDTIQFTDGDRVQFIITAHCEIVASETLCLRAVTCRYRSRGRRRFLGDH